MAGDIILGQPELVNGGDLLQTLRVLQETVTAAPFDLQRTMMAEALGVIGMEPTHFGSSKVELHAHQAFLGNDHQTRESEILDFVLLEDAWVSGWLGPPVDLKLGSTVETISLTLTKSKIRTTRSHDVDALNDVVADATYANGAEIRRPILVPLWAIESMLVAA